MNATVPPPAIESVTAAVTAVPAGCDRPNLATLTTTRRGITSRAETQPQAARLHPDMIAATLADMARLVGRYPGMCDDVAAYAIILPAQRVAVAVDRDGRHYDIQLPGAPTEPLTRPVWDTAHTGLAAMITAITG